MSHSNDNSDIFKQELQMMFDNMLITKNEYDKMIRAYNSLETSRQKTYIHSKEEVSSDLEPKHELVEENVILSSEPVISDAVRDGSEIAEPGKPDIDRKSYQPKMTQEERIEAFLQRNRVAEKQQSKLTSLMQGQRSKKIVAHEDKEGMTRNSTQSSLDKQINDLSAPQSNVYEKTLEIRDEKVEKFHIDDQKNTKNEDKSAWNRNDKNIIPVEHSVSVIKKSFSKLKNSFTFDNERERNLTLILGIGSVMMLLGGLIFATTSWSTFSVLGKVMIFFSVSVVFLIVGKVAESLKIHKTSFAFTSLAFLFLPLTVISCSFYGVFGEFLSWNGEGRYLFASIAGIIFTFLYHRVALKYGNIVFKWISLTVFYITIVFMSLMVTPSLQYAGLILSVLVLLFNKYDKSIADHFAFYAEEIPVFTIIATSATALFGLVMSIDGTIGKLSILIMSMSFALIQSKQSDDKPQYQFMSDGLVILFIISGWLGSNLEATLLQFQVLMSVLLAVASRYYLMSPYFVTSDKHKDLVRATHPIVLMVGSVGTLLMGGNSVSREISLDLSNLLYIMTNVILFVLVVKELWCNRGRFTGTLTLVYTYTVALIFGLQLEVQISSLLKMLLFASLITEIIFTKDEEVRFNKQNLINSNLYFVLLFFLTLNAFKSFNLMLMTFTLIPLLLLLPSDNNSIKFEIKNRIYLKIMSFGLALLVAPVDIRSSVWVLLVVGLIFFVPYVSKYINLELKMGDSIQIYQITLAVIMVGTILDRFNPLGSQSVFSIVLPLISMIAIIWVVLIELKHQKESLNTGRVMMLGVIAIISNLPGDGVYKVPMLLLALSVLALIMSSWDKLASYKDVVDQSFSVGFMLVLVYQTLLNPILVSNLILALGVLTYILGFKKEYESENLAKYFLGISLFGFYPILWNTSLLTQGLCHLVYCLFIAKMSKSEQDTDEKVFVSGGLILGYLSLVLQSLMQMDALTIRLLFNDDLVSAGLLLVGSTVSLYGLNSLAKQRKTKYLDLISLCALLVLVFAWSLKITQKLEITTEIVSLIILILVRLVRKEKYPNIYKLTSILFLYASFVVVNGLMIFDGNFKIVPTIFLIPIILTLDAEKRNIYSSSFIVYMLATLISGRFVLHPIGILDSIIDVVGLLLISVMVIVMFRKRREQDSIASIILHFTQWIPIVFGMISLYGLGTNGLFEITMVIFATAIAFVVQWHIIKENGFIVSRYILLILTYCFMYLSIKGLGFSPADNLLMLTGFSLITQGYSVIQRHDDFLDYVLNLLVFIVILGINFENIELWVNGILVLFESLVVYRFTDTTTVSVPKQAFFITPVLISLGLGFVFYEFIEIWYVVIIINFGLYLYSKLTQDRSRYAGLIVSGVMFVLAILTGILNFRSLEYQYFVLLLPFLGILLIYEFGNLFDKSWISVSYGLMVLLTFGLLPQVLQLETMVFMIAIEAFVFVMVLLRMAFKDSNPWFLRGIIVAEHVLIVSMIVLHISIMTTNPWLMLIPCLYFLKVNLDQDTQKKTIVYHVVFLVVEALSLILTLEYLDIVESCFGLSLLMTVITAFIMQKSIGKWKETMHYPLLGVMLLSAVLSFSMALNHEFILSIIDGLIICAIYFSAMSKRYPKTGFVPVVYMHVLVTVALQTFDERTRELGIVVWTLLIIYGLLYFKKTYASNSRIRMEIWNFVSIVLFFLTYVSLRGANMLGLILLVGGFGRVRIGLNRESDDIMVAVQRSLLYLIVYLAYIHMGVILDVRGLLLTVLEYLDYLVPVILISVCLRTVWIESMESKDARMMYFVESGLLAFSIFGLTLRTLSNTTIETSLIFSVITLGMLVIGYVVKVRSYFLLGGIALVASVLYNQRHFWTSLPWWVYLSMAGILLLAIGSMSEWFRQNKKQDQFKDQVKKFFESWS